MPLPTRAPLDPAPTFAKAGLPNDLVTVLSPDTVVVEVLGWDEAFVAALRARLEAGPTSVRRITPSVIVCNNPHQMEVFGVTGASVPDRGLLNVYVATARNRAVDRLRRESKGIDYWGMGMLVLGIGALQIVLDKGQQEDWFASTFITSWPAVALLSTSAINLDTLGTIGRAPFSSSPLPNRIDPLLGFGAGSRPSRFTASPAAFLAPTTSSRLYITTQR